MPADYEAIRRDNEREYGQGIPRWGPEVLSDRYAERTHFIFELLQNTEDAYARRQQWSGPRSVSFDLSPTRLCVTHFGKPFDEADVRGICGIGLSTKDLTSIGRFGIGFKSVYAFTARPEIHSHPEHFTIEHFVWPKEVQPIGLDPESTRIVLPLDHEASEMEISKGLRQLGPRTLLFLREIEEIAWQLSDGTTGLYLRGKPQELADSIHRVSLLGQDSGRPDVEEVWLVFSHAVEHEGRQVGHVEIAFQLGSAAQDGDRLQVQRVNRSPLVVYFPTVLETHLGFLAQGPYRTTPSRDNVPAEDPWNEKLVTATAGLLVRAVRWMRDNCLLDVNAMLSLPLDGDRFDASNMFAPVFGAVRAAFMEEPLLPKHPAGYTTAKAARLARTSELRELFDPLQLAALFEKAGDIYWIAGEVTKDKTGEIWDYLVDELKVEQVAPDKVMLRLTAAFLEQQPVEWLARLYAFIEGQPGLKKRIQDLPLIRLQDGSHVQAQRGGQPMAFLPSEVQTAFPTVHSELAANPEAREFLESIGLTEPDTVDDVIRNILPRYPPEVQEDAAASYGRDMAQILKAFETDSKAQRTKLVAALRECRFVRAVDVGSGTTTWSKPTDLYIASDRLKQLFAGVQGVLLVDDSLECLKGEVTRELLEACGAARYLQPVPTPCDLTEDERRNIRSAAGCEDRTYDVMLTDQTLRGLMGLLERFPALAPADRAARGAILWSALRDVEDRRGSSAFHGSYRWMFHRERSASFDASFVRQLRDCRWIPKPDGTLHLPMEVEFDCLKWEQSLFLASKLRFRPPALEALARETGIDSEVLFRLQKLGVTNVAELEALLRPESRQDQQPEGVEEPSDDSDGSSDRGSTGLESDPTVHLDTNEGSSVQKRGTSSGRVGEPEGLAGTSNAERKPETGLPGSSAKSEDLAGQATPRSGKSSPRSFVSYVQLAPEEELKDPDGLEHEQRMALEASAIEFIRSIEPFWRSTDTNNVGFDLHLPARFGRRPRWAEVKAMKGSLQDRPVGISRAQFDFALQHRADFWLYIVEHAGTENARLVRIQDPVGQARTFTFDRGWLAAASERSPDFQYDQQEDRDGDE